MTSTQFSPTTVPIEFAESAIEAGNKRAAEIGLPFTITVVDAGANLVAASRMDGDVLGSIEVSATKARTPRCYSDNRPRSSTPRCSEARPCSVSKARSVGLSRLWQGAFR